ncbi:hypothetical protein K4L44_03545 [Halosquirtibacter laminarini]|uniref:Uncharacterized protein n=1 Tax=Halosquirtibacter laminarini TaxID=3374600 RepID=A0AC61NGZ5_9BACT|nr:hypothetical protein K4L44_03545 [Prolixibacteraceae bacterium]
MDSLNNDLEQKRREATLKEIKRLQGVNSRLQNTIIILIVAFVVVMGASVFMARKGNIPFIPTASSDTVTVVQHDTIFMADEGEQKNDIIGTDFYAIQIGYYKHLKQIIPIKAQSDLEVIESQGAKIFTLAKFNTYQEANANKRLVKKVGFKDAFIVHYVNGQRVPISK